jgi:hypothetical protein
MAKRNDQAVYDNVFETLFLSKYHQNPNVKEIGFTKDEIAETASRLKKTIRNFPDVIYTYRARRELPNKILATGHWIIKPAGKGKYVFKKTERPQFIEIQEGLAPIEVLNAIPEIVEKYSANDEQGLLSTIRYNRLVDIFTKITCFHLQSHIRTTIQHEGQIEIDDLYVGIDQEGKEYILPLEAKSPDERDKMGWIQITNLVRYARQYFPNLLCRPLATKPVGPNQIYMIEFEDETDYEKIGIKELKFYKLIRQNTNAA